MQAEEGGVGTDLSTDHFQVNATEEEGAVMGCQDDVQEGLILPGSLSYSPSRTLVKQERERVSWGTKRRPSPGHEPQKGHWELVLGFPKNSLVGWCCL